MAKVKVIRPRTNLKLSSGATTTITGHCLPTIESAKEFLTDNPALVLVLRHPADKSETGAIRQVRASEPVRAGSLIGIGIEDVKGVGDARPVGEIVS